MTVLDQVMDMKSRGISDQDIIRNLQEQKVSPAEIRDSLSRAQIKSAISNLGRNGDLENGSQRSVLNQDVEPQSLPTEGNISDVDLTPPIPSGFMPQQVPMNVRQEIGKEPELEQPQDQSGMYIPEENYYQPQPQYQPPDYPQQSGYGSAYGYSSAGMDTDTMIEVAEQVFSEKNRPLQKKMDDINEFKTLAQTNIDYISERLKKIEATIDKLQASILEKVGSYGYGLESVRKEVGMMQDSFGKMVSNIADRSEERHHHYTQPRPAVTVQRSRKTTRKTYRR